MIKLKYEIFNNKANKTEDVSLPEFFANDALIAKYIYVYQDNQRSYNRKTKDRSEVSGGGRKPWKQKGTGRARHGSNRSPIWKGGGVTFGVSNVSRIVKINKKEKKLVFNYIFVNLLKEGRILVSSDSGDLNYKNIDSLNSKVSLVSDMVSDAVSVQNHKNIKSISSNELSAYDLMQTGKYVFTKNAFDTIVNKRILKNG